MRKWIGIALCALSLTGSGCVTMVSQDEIKKSGFNDSQKAALEVVTFPVTAAVDVALAPVEIVGTGVVVAALMSGHPHF
jgi:hypothetical protein